MNIALHTGFGSRGRVVYNRLLEESTTTIVRKWRKGI
jgi:hypothetical protein